MSIIDWKFDTVDPGYFLAGDTKFFCKLLLEFGWGGLGRDFDFYLGDLRMLLTWDDEGGDNIFYLAGLRKFWGLLNSTWMGFLGKIVWGWCCGNVGTELILELENGVFLWRLL